MEEENPQKQQMAIFQEEEDGISVPNWLVEVLAWITRIEMANSQMSFSCKLFKQLCWPKLHENVEPLKITELELYKSRHTNSGYFIRNRCGQSLSIPNVTPPPYILDFLKHIYINFLDPQLPEFLKNILPRLNQIKFTLKLHFNRMIPDDKETDAFWRFLNLLANKIVKFEFSRCRVSVSEFDWLFPGFIQKAHFLCACPIPEEFDTLFYWLTLPPINREKRQKILELERSNENDIDKFVNRIKEEFSNTSEPQNFFIICPSASRFAQFNMENEKTGEILALYSSNRGILNYIVRCPKGEEDFWSREGQQLWVYEDEDPTTILVHI